MAGLVRGEGLDQRLPVSFEPAAAGHVDGMEAFQRGHLVEEIPVTFTFVKRGTRQIRLVVRVHLGLVERAATEAISPWS